MTDADDLPDGWAVATIEDLCTLNPKHPATVGDTTEVSFVPMAAVSDLDGRIVGTETRKYGEVKKGYTHFADGDVIFAKITPCMENGKAASVRGLVNGLACGTTEFFVFRSRGAVDQDYLFHFIRQESFRKAARATMQSGVGQARVPKEFVLNTELPLPPLAEQRRIVAKVEELTARSRAARAALAEVPTLLEQFRQSVLASAFRGDLTADWRAKNPTAEPASVLLDRIRAERRKQWETKYPKKKYVAPEPVDDSDLPELPEGWCWATVEELVSATDYGTSAKTNEDNTGVPVLRMGNIVEGRLSLASLKFLPADHDEFPKLMLRAGDVLFNRTNSPELVGKAAVYSGQPERCSFASYLIRLRLDALNPYLLAAYINSPYGRAWIRSVVQQQVGQANVNGTKLMALAVPVPPVLEQRVIAERIELSQSGLSAAANVLAETLADLDTLDQSILAKAFRGELVPQDSADEPAAALLARIRSGVSATRSVERGRVKFYILLLLRTWNKPLSREMLERGLVLMLNADVRRAILGRSKPAPNRWKKPATPPRFVSGLDAFLGEMLDDGDLVPGPEAGFFAEGQHGFDLAAAPKADLDAVRETAEAMKVIHKDKLQATDADIVSALHGEIYELVS